MLKLLRLINPRVDANDGALTTNNPRLGNRTFGDAMFLTGTTDVLPTTDSGVIHDGFESITVSSSVIRLSISEVTDHDSATIDVESQAIRFRVDGVADPTASVGRVASAGDIIKLTDPSELANFRAIRRDGSDATLRVTYGHRRTT
jgi:hypothetical protein|tara:strand:- start:152 stop:589 length:438 start_codon:yes stop_codon:yes gene_type:complete